MSYCKKCGAYIPDGQDVCLACGFDEAPPMPMRRKATMSSAARRSCAGAPSSAAVSSRR